MKKIKLAICMKDLEYQTRFVNCFMNHYKNLYELHVFTQLGQLKMTEPLEYVAIITGEYTIDEMADFVERGELVLNLSEHLTGDSDESIENYIRIEKYQEVYKIAEVLERLVADYMPKKHEGAMKEYELIGVYSLSQEKYQIPFAALLAELYGEEKKVLLLDLQSYSGLGEQTGMAMGLEDLLSVVTTGNYSRSRLLECIRHEANWEYIFPAQNTQCVAEATSELYGALIELLAKELGYQIIIINFGTTFLGHLELMEQCKKIYMLHAKESSDAWREQAFSVELMRMEKEILLKKIRQVELPLCTVKEISWRSVKEKWIWGTFAEKIRGMLKEASHGAIM